MQQTLSYLCIQNGRSARFRDADNERCDKNSQGSAGGAAVSFLYGKDVVVYSKWYGKLATVLFYLAIVVTLFIKQLALTGIWEYLDLGIYCCALVCTVFSLVMYVKCLYQGGFIDKSDLSKETKNVVVKDKWSFKKQKKS